MSMTSGVAPREPPGRPLTGVDVDMVADGTTLSDELHTVDDVVTLCDMLAARRTLGSCPATHTVGQSPSRSR